MSQGVSVVVPTVGRASLTHLLAALAAAPPPPLPVEVLVVDDRRGGPPLRLPAVAGAHPQVLAGQGRGPAAARNLGWRAAQHPWVSFLDDDVAASALLTSEQIQLVLKTLRTVRERVQGVPTTPDQFWRQELADELRALLVVVEGGA